jgi:RNA polymerase sigma-70 factor (ECF subfamily)
VREPEGPESDAEQSPRPARSTDAGITALHPPNDVAIDVALVRRAREGDGDAFGMLVRRHLAAAHAAAYAVLRETEDAEDACQDAFVSALRRLEDCRPEEKFRPWLLAIVRNRAIDLRRRRQVRQADSLDEIGDGASPPTRAVGPLRDAERADARDHLARAIATLTDVRREVVLLHDLEGWSHREIGTHLGLAEGTVRAHLFWARRDLRKRLSAEWRRESDDKD